MSGLPEAGGRGAGPEVWCWPRWRSVVCDALLALLSAVECAAGLGEFGERFGAGGWPGGLLGFLLGGTLLSRRRYPLALTLLSVAISPTESGLVLGLVALYTLAAYRRDRRTVLCVGGVASGAALLLAVLETRRDAGLEQVSAQERWEVTLLVVVAAVALTASPLLLGLYVGARRRVVEALRERARTLESEQRLLGERARQRAWQARVEERSRIAREMHDVVAHRVSLMVVHAGAVQTVAERDPAGAVESAGLVADVGRQALNELRQILGVLRGDTESGAGVAPEEGGSGGASEPGALDAPVLADLENLVGQSRAAGVPVWFSLGGEPRRLGAELESTAYRVAQEALTNVHKHAGGAETEVSVEYGASVVRVRVANGPGTGAASTGIPSGGHGLLGMRERVRELSGTFESGPVEGGGFVVLAELPCLPARQDREATVGAAGVAVVATPRARTCQEPSESRVSTTSAGSSTGDAD